MAESIEATGLIDTDILIDAAHDLADATAFLKGQRQSGGIHISAISAMELLTGCQDSVARARTERFLRQVTEVPLNPAGTALARPWITRYYLSHGLLIPDALIAATAVEQGLPLYTRNARHFGVIPDLDAVAPY